MKKILTILGIFLLVLTACSSQTTTGTLPSQAGVPQAVPSTVTKNTADAETTLIGQVQADTESKNDKTKDLVLPIAYKKGKAGDSVVFGLMFNQVNRPKNTYLARITFIEGRDSNSNKIEISGDVAKSWLKESETLPFNIESAGSQFVPVVFRVKDGIPHGTYQYEVQFYEVLSNTPGDVTKLDTFVKEVYLGVE